MTCVQLVVAGVALVQREPGEVVAPEHGGAGPPLVVGHDRHHDPLLLAGAAVRALRCPPFAAVAAVRRGGHTIDRRRHEGFAGQGGRAFALGQIDVRALAGSMAAESARDTAAAAYTPPTGSP